MERKPSRIETFLEPEDNLDFAGELIRLSRSEKGGDFPGDGSADEIVYADTQRLADELSAEYSSLCDAIQSMRR